MDRPFATSTVKTVWGSFIQRRSMEEILRERTEAVEVYDKEKSGLEKAESVDLHGEYK